MKPATSPKHPKRSRLLTCLFALAAVGFLYAHLEPFWIATKTIPIADADVPAGFDDTRIVFVSDIHHGPYFSRQRLKRLVQRINALNPDLVLLGGDYVHRSPRFIRPCFAELAHLQAPLGVYGVLGNHDHWVGAAASREAMVKAGIHPLDNRGYWIFRGWRRIRIGGVGDFYADTPDLHPVLVGVEADDFTILVSHNPDFVEEIGPYADRIDLVLCGHTHGGQVTFFGLWAPLVPSKYGQKYRSGVMDFTGMKTIVTNGIGTVTPPVRFFARPQIVVVALKRGDPQSSTREEPAQRRPVL